MQTRDFFKYNSLGIASMLAILFLCLTPTPIRIKDLGFFEVDKLAHFCIYILLTLLNTWGLKRYSRVHFLFTSPLLLAVVVSVLWGLMIEFLQEWLPTGRFFEWYDMLANCIGIAAAAICARYLSFLK
jgi:VanZ family protein